MIQCVYYLFKILEGPNGEFYLVFIGA